MTVATLVQNRYQLFEIQTVFSLIPFQLEKKLIFELLLFFLQVSSMLNWQQFHYAQKVQSMEIFVVMLYRDHCFFEPEK